MPLFGPLATIRNVSSMMLVSYGVKLWRDLGSGWIRRGNRWRLYVFMGLVCALQRIKLSLHLAVSNASE